MLRSVFSFVVFAAIVCVAVIFFHPAVSGPFASTHGPVTALRARQVALLIAMFLFACAMLLREILFFVPQCAASSSLRDRIGLPHDQVFSLNCAFRC